jgi:lipopolysaccharide export LptBFGC system permease protein LptF
MFAKQKERKARTLRMKELQASIDAVYKDELNNASTPQDREVAYQVIRAQVEDNENELTHLQQIDLTTKANKAGITIPMEFYSDYGGTLKTTLSYAGEMWVKREVKKHDRAEIEFWFKLVLPLVSLLLSVIALLEKH